MTSPPKRGRRAAADSAESSTPHQPPIAGAHIRTGLTSEAIAPAVVDNLHCLLGKLPQYATRNDWYMALAYTVRDRLLDRYTRTVERFGSADSAVRAVAYLSAEFL